MSQGQKCRELWVEGGGEDQVQVVEEKSRPRGPGWTFSKRAGREVESSEGSCTVHLGQRVGSLKARVIGGQEVSWGQVLVA